MFNWTHYIVALIHSAHRFCRCNPISIRRYDHKHVIAGQGTAGKELFEDIKRQHGIDGLDYMFVCVGGGGLISGCALSAHHFSPNCKVIGVEPEAGNDAQQSLEKGEIVHIATPGTIADGAQTQHIGKLNFAVMQKEVEKIMAVSDAELVSCMRFFGERMKMIVEPTGCLALAGLKKAIASGEVLPGSRCGVIISGGNVDLSRYSELLSKYDDGEYSPLLPQKGTHTASCVL